MNKNNFSDSLLGQFFYFVGMCFIFLAVVQSMAIIWNFSLLGSSDPNNTDLLLVIIASLCGVTMVRPEVPETFSQISSKEESGYRFFQTTFGLASISFFVLTIWLIKKAWYGDMIAGFPWSLFAAIAAVITFVLGYIFCASGKICFSEPSYRNY